MGGIGAAAGPLIGGLITSAISWRAAFVFQALVIAVIVVLSRRIDDPLPADPTRHFDILGAVLSAVGLVLVVMGILAADDNLVLTLALMVVGALVLVGFFLTVRAKERAGEEPLLSTALFRNRTSNLGLVTQNTQWLMLIGTSFVVSAYLQVVRGYDAVETGVIFTAATAGPADFVDRRRAPRQAVPTTDPDPGRLRRHARRDRCPARPGERFPERLGLRTGALRDRTGHRRDADPLGQRRAVELPRAPAGRDLGAVAQRVQPRLVARRRHRRHDPRGRYHVGPKALLRARDGRIGSDRHRRAGGLRLPTSKACFSDPPADTAWDARELGRRSAVATGRQQRMRVLVLPALLVSAADPPGPRGAAGS